MRYWHGEDLEVIMLLRLSVLTGEHVNYSQVITRGSLLFTQFMITLLYWRLSTQIPLISINFQREIIFSSAISYAQHHTDSEQIVILILHFLINQKYKNVILTK